MTEVIVTINSVFLVVSAAVTFLVGNLSVTNNSTAKFGIGQQHICSFASAVAVLK
jgi:hypothetical protein